MERLFIVIPAYNEQANIRSVVQQWIVVVNQINALSGCEAHLVVADDGSQDATGSILQELQHSYPLLTAVTKPNSGHGATLLFLYRYALDQGAHYVFQTDSDGQTDPAEFWPFFECRHQYDLLIGRRIARQDGMSRRFVSKVLQLVLQCTLHVRVTDANTPFRLMQSDKLRLLLQAVPDSFFLSNALISALAIRWQMKVNFLPITFKPRQGGVNSINLRRIVKIGCLAVCDFLTINKALKFSHQ